MANLNFRPRPIDINRAIPIFTDAEAEELDDRDYTSVSGVSRGVPKMPTGMEAEDEEEAHIQEAIKRSLKQWESEGKEIVDIPTPKVKIVKDYDDDEKIIKPFIRPQVYIKWKDYTPDELDQTIEYDMDSEDENFLNQINANKKILSEAKFEYLIDRFEKETDKNGDIPSFELVEQLIPFKNQILQIIYNYWIDKRKKFKIPLNYRFLKPPDPDDPSPYKAFRPRTEEKLKRKYRKNDQTSLVRMKQLRQEMERARMLLEMIKKRERLKKERIQIIKEILEFQLNSNLLNNSNEIKFFKKKEKFSINSLQKNRYLLLNNMDEYSSDIESLSENENSKDLFSLNLDNEIEPILTIRTPYCKTIKVNGIPSFRGRARIGRGGRIIFDRKPTKISLNGIVHCFETDNEYDPRINSIIGLKKSGFHPSLYEGGNMEKILKTIQK